MLKFCSTIPNQSSIRRLEICVSARKVVSEKVQKSKYFTGNLPIPADKGQNDGFLTMSRILQLSPKEVQLMSLGQLADLPSQKVWLGIRRDDKTLYWMDLYSGRRITYDSWAIKRSFKDVKSKVICFFVE